MVIYQEKSTYLSVNFSFFPISHYNLKKRIPQINVNTIIVLSSINKLKFVLVVNFPIYIFFIFVPNSYLQSMVNETKKLFELNFILFYFILGFFCKNKE